MNRWMYVEGNPINLTDPSGKFPHPWAINGYAEGYTTITSDWFGIRSIIGKETVYDFASMQSAEFTTSGRVDPITNVVDNPTGNCLNPFPVVSTEAHFSYIVGFDYGPNKGIGEYRGNFQSIQGGADLLSLLPEISGPGGQFLKTLQKLSGITVSFDIGFSIFQSETRPHFLDYPELWGFSISTGASANLTDGDTINLPASIATYTTYSSPPKNIVPYYNINGRANDLKRGNRSPVTIPILSPIMRDAAIAQLNYIEENREEIP